MATRSRRDVKGPWQEFDELLAEPFIRGRELTVAVLDDEALAVTELRPKSGFYDYDAKYTDGMTEHVCPADIPDEIADAALGDGAEAHRLLGCRGASRSDFRWDDEQGEAGLYLLEVNTQPGMTPLSLVPEQARAARHRLCDPGRADRGGGVMSAQDRARRAGARARPKPRANRVARRQHAQAEEAGPARIRRRLAGLDAPARQLDAGRHDLSRSSSPRCSPSACRSSPASRSARASAAPASPCKRVEINGRPARLAARHLQCRLRPGFDGDAAGRPRGDARAAAPLRLDPRGAGLAAAARHARRRHRRAPAGRDLAEQPAIEPDRRRRRRAGAGPDRCTCPTCRW